MENSPRKNRKGGKAQSKVEKVMHEFKQGTLKSNGKQVSDRNQAIAIALSEAREIDPKYQMPPKKCEGGGVDTYENAGSPRKRSKGSIPKMQTGGNPPYNKTIDLGKVDYDGRGKKLNAVDIETRIKNKDTATDWETLKEVKNVPVLSMIGNIWNSRHSDALSAGQNYDTIRELFPNNKLVNRLIDIWKKYANNDLKAGTKKQTEAIEKWKEKGNEYEFSKASEHLKKINLYEDKGYEYGSSWLYQLLPDSVIKELKSLLDELSKDKKENAGKAGDSTGYQTGATSDEVNKLILHASNDGNLVKERDAIYNMAIDGQWNEARLNQQFKRIFSYMTETSYNKEVPAEKIQMGEVQRNEFAQLYTDNLTNWKKDKGISKEEAGNAGDDNNSDTSTEENGNGENGTEENGIENGNGVEVATIETVEVVEVVPVGDNATDANALLQQASDTLAVAEDHAHATDGSIESARRAVNQVQENISTDSDSFKKGGSPKKISQEKQKMLDKITKIEDALDSEKTSLKSRERLTKELEALRKQYERRVPVAERIAMNKGKFYIEMPLEYRENMNSMLWGKNIRPHYTALGDKMRISVDSKPRLNRVYSIYSVMLNKRGKPVPSLEEISGKPTKVKKRR